MTPRMIDSSESSLLISLAPSQERWVGERSRLGRSNAIPSKIWWIQNMQNFVGLLTTSEKSMLNNDKEYEGERFPVVDGSVYSTITSSLKYVYNCSGE